MLQRAIVREILVQFTGALGSCVRSSLLNGPRLQYCYFWLGRWGHWGVLADFACGLDGSGMRFPAGWGNYCATGACSSIPCTQLHTQGDWSCVGAWREASSDGCLHSSARRKSAPTNAAAAERIICQGPMQTMRMVLCHAAGPLSKLDHITMLLFSCGQQGQQHTTYNGQDMHIRPLQR